jgi:hypothetical protein
MGSFILFSRPEFSFSKRYYSLAGHCTHNGKYTSNGIDYNNSKGSRKSHGIHETRE